MTDSELRKRANERLDAWLRDYDKRAAEDRLNTLIDDVAATIGNYSSCLNCGEERAWVCPECGEMPHESKAVIETLDAVREEIDRQVDLFNLAS